MSSKQLLNRTKLFLKKISDWANHHEALLLLLLTVLLLRLPTFSAPYWYGDEAIYLTIGNALRQGQHLYSEIVDHKTPLIYYLAAVPDQLSFRLLMTAWMLASTTIFYTVSKQIFSQSNKLAWISTLLFVFGTNLPLLEGNIPNGELFVIGLTLLSWWLLTKTSFWKLFLKQKTALRTNRRDYIWSFLAGLVAGGGLLTKVPALLDIAALGSLFLWWFLLSIWQRLRKPSKQRVSVAAPLLGGIMFTVGFLLPLIGSAIYYYLQGSLDAYLQFGLLYNFHYTSNWTVPIETSWIANLFNLLPKTIILVSAGLIGSLLFIKPRSNWKMIFFSWWMFLALFASVLSNRPYPHYLIQLVPPLSVLLVLLFTDRRSLFSLSRLYAITPLLLTVVTFWLLKFTPYPVFSYYQHYFAMVSGQITVAEYQQKFNYLVDQNTYLAKIITANTNADDKIFIWGTNPMLYALTRRVPASRFTVAFHIHDLQVYEQTLNEVKQYQPEYIVVMKEEQPWLELNQYIDDHYLFVTATDNMELYRRSSLTTLWLIQ